MNKVIFSALVLLLLVSSAHAGKYIYRSYEEPQNIISGKVRVDLSVSYSGSAGDESYSGSETVYIPVNLVIKVAGDASLRPGERESFTIRSREGSGSTVQFKLIANTVFDYEVRQVSELEPLRAMKKHGVNFIPTVTFILTPLGRKKIRPPMTIEAVQATFGSANEPVAIEFIDAGEEHDGGAATSYSFRLFRNRTMWFDVEVANGTFSGSTNEVQRLIITPESEYLTGKEYFIPGKDYRLEIALKKKGQDYLDEWTKVKEFDFTYDPSGPTYSRDTKRMLLFNKMRTE